MMRAYSKKCDSCERQPADLYMVTDELWATSNLDGWVCFRCLEAAIGRRLVPADFKPHLPANTDEVYHEAELRTRMGLAEQHREPANAPTDRMTLEERKAAVQLAKDVLHGIQRSRDEQPGRLAEARDRADEARGWALIEEPFDNQVTSISSVDGNTALTLPNLLAKELWGARLCFDLLDCGDDYDQIDSVMSRLFSTVNGDTGIAFLIATSALSTIASVVVPRLLDELEHRASNYDERVKLAEARAKAWNGRVSEIRDRKGTDE